MNEKFERMAIVGVEGVNMSNILYDILIELIIIF